jgi:hypothetical protein
MFLLALKYWKEVLLVLLLMAVAGFLVHIHEEGIREGEQKTQLSQLESDKSQVLNALSTTNGVLTQQGALIAAQNAQLAAGQAQLANLKAKQAQASQSVAALAPTAVQGDLELKAGGPLSNPEILRKIDDSYTQLPILTAQLANVVEQSKILTDQVEAISKERDALSGELGTLIPAYTRAYNAAQKKHSLFIKIITLGLVRDRHLDLPDPTTLGK